MYIIWCNKSDDIIWYLWYFFELSDVSQSIHKDGFLKIRDVAFQS